MAGVRMENQQGDPGITLLQLDPFEEVTGELLGIEICNGQLAIQLSVGTLKIRSNSEEADILLAELTGAEGHRVWIVRTGKHHHPICVLIGEEV